LRVVRNHTKVQDAVDRTGPVGALLVEDTDHELAQPGVDLDVDGQFLPNVAVR